MNKFFGALAFAATLGIAGAAQAGFVETSFGNTVTVSGPDGAVMQTLHFDEGGTFDVTLADGNVLNGTWVMTDGQLCTTVGDEANCNDVQDIDVGDSWTITTDDGTELTVSIVAGH